MVLHCRGSREWGLLGFPSLFRANIIAGARLSIKARWSVGTVLDWACGVNSGLVEVGVIPILESHLLGWGWPLRVSNITEQAGQLLLTSHAVSLSFRFSKNPLINTHRQKASPSVVPSWKRNAKFFPLNTYRD